MSEPIYECTFDIRSRHASRSAQWTTKHVRETFQNMGYEINGLYVEDRFYKRPKNPDQCIYQRICFSGTREECIAIRTELTTTLRIITRGTWPPQFKSKKI